MNVLLSFILALLPNLPIQQLDRTLSLVELGVSTAVPTIEQVSGSEQLCSNVVDMATTIKEAEDRIEQERLEQERLEQERLAQESQKAYVSNTNSYSTSYVNNTSYDSYSQPSYQAPAMVMGNYGRLYVGGYSWALESRGFQDIVDRGDCWVGEGYPLIFGAHNYMGFTAIEWASTATWYKPDGSVVTLYKVSEDWNAHNYYTVQKSNGEYYYQNPAGPIAMYTCTSASGNDVYLSYWTY